MNPKQGSSVDEFFNDLPKGDKKDAPDIFGDGKAPDAHSLEKGDGAGEGEGSDAEPRKNRRHRRLEQQLQAEREANIALNERLKVKSEAEEFARETGGEVDARLLTLFGTDDKGKEAARLFSEMRADDRQAAKKLALQEFEERQAQTVREQREYETFIDSELENLEDEHDVDLTSDSPAARKARREFLELVQNLSPKDEEGNLAGFADFESAFDVYKKTKNESKPDASNDRRKEMSSNSMQRPGGGSGGIPPKITPGFRGWMKDYNVRS